MLTPLLVTLALLHQAPASPGEPITVLIAPPDTVGVPAHVVEFAQEHLAEQAKSRGVTVVRMKDFIRKVPAAKRRTLMKCKRTELKCLTALGQAANTEVVLVAELLQRMDGYRVGTKVYKTQDGGLVAEHLIPGVREDGMLDALTQSLDVVVPMMTKALRPSAAGPETKPPETKPPEVKPPPVGEKPPEVKPPPVGEKPPEVKPPPVKPEPVTPAPRTNLRRWAWAPAAGGVALAGVGTYFFLQAQDRYNQLDKKGASDAPLDGAKLASEGRQKQNLSRIFFGLGAAGLVTGGVFYLFPGDEKPVHPTVTLGPGGGMVGVVGTLP
ncbi:MAG: hypothetical protein ACJ8AT_10890 [Hyalangium sp.]|uniref:hypothetical protein n=1 Tax=Hyalangium sp. TaxID=2028555 RepID=UPI00389B0CE0